VALAVFLPVLIGQSVNTGCQTLAVALRGMTLGELKAEGEVPIVVKETLLGFLNGIFTGGVRRQSACSSLLLFREVQWP